jgi:hypothetical protein
MWTTLSAAQRRIERDIKSALEGKDVGDVSALLGA